jgi:hypothetical protein
MRALHFFAVAAAALAFAATAPAASKADKSFTDSFAVDKSELASTGTNRFFILLPGHQSVFEGQDKGKTVQLTITVLNETKLVDGVETRVVEERETLGGELVEISRNYFAISTKTSDVFYFGEDVDSYKKGNITSHGGAWLSGVGGARFGMMMPGRPLLGARYHQEVAPKVAMDRAEIVSLTESLETKAGKFENCLKTEETTPLEIGKSHKLYAPGVGLISDGDVKLVKHGMLAKH